MLSPDHLRLNMSLKAFHIFFVVVATLATVGFGGWAGWRAMHGGPSGYTLVAVGSALFAVILVVYGIWFLRKLKHLSFV